LSKSKDLVRVGLILAQYPKNSPQYKEALKTLDALLEMPAELTPEGDESYDDGEQEAD
jgi:hypothetical protein